MHNVCKAMEWVVSGMLLCVNIKHHIQSIIGYDKFWFLIQSQIQKNTYHFSHEYPDETSQGVSAVMVFSLPPLAFILKCEKQSLNCSWAVVCNWVPSNGCISKDWHKWALVSKIPISSALQHCSTVAIEQQPRIASVPPQREQLKQSRSDTALRCLLKASKASPCATTHTLFWHTSCMLSSCSVHLSVCVERFQLEEAAAALKPGIRPVKVRWLARFLRFSLLQLRSTAAATATALCELTASNIGRNLLVRCVAHSFKN